MLLVGQDGHRVHRRMKDNNTGCEELRVRHMKILENEEDVSRSSRKMSVHVNVAT